MNRSYALELARRASLIGYCELGGASGRKAEAQVVDRVLARVASERDPFAQLPVDLAAERERLYESLVLNLMAGLHRRSVPGSVRES